jgi:hypothetical protein
MTSKATFDAIQRGVAVLKKVAPQYGWKLIGRVRSDRSEATYIDFERDESHPLAKDKNIGDYVDIRLATHPPYHSKSFVSVDLNPYHFPSLEEINQAFQTGDFRPMTSRRVGNFDLSKIS